MYFDEAMLVSLLLCRHKIIIQHLCTFARKTSLKIIIEFYQYSIFSLPHFYNLKIKNRNRYHYVKACLFRLKEETFLGPTLVHLIH